MNVVLALQLFLVSLFARSVWHKLAHHQTFYHEFEAYQLLPSALTGPAVYLLIAAEGFCALGLLFTPLAMITTLVLLTTYALAISINLLRGKHQIDCGCGGWLTPRRTLAWSLVWRNSVLCGLAMLCLLLPIPSQTSGLAIGHSLLIALTLGLLYEATEQSIGNKQRYQNWLQRRTV